MAKRPKKKKTGAGDISRRDFAGGSFATTEAAWSGRDWQLCLVLLAAVFVAYLPVWRAGYLWDDDLMLTRNPCIIGPLGLKEMWTTSEADICPLTLTTLWFEHKLWGLAPLPYHLVNVLLHGLSAVVLWRVLRSLAVPGAWLGAALWALHPVQVESVAWITEMKNTQSGLFFLLSILFFLKWLSMDRVARKSWNGNYALTLAFAAMAIASKSSTVLLPVVLCLCAWRQEGRWKWRNVTALVPIFAMSLVAGAVSGWTQGLQTMVANDPLQARTWPDRLVMAGASVWFYLGKLMWPHPLVTIYPPLQFDAGRLVSYLPLLAAAGTLFVLWWNRKTWARHWFFAFAYFLVMLLPVLGLADNFIFRYSLVFDHFQYLASMGPLALIGAVIVRITDRFAPNRAWPRVVFGGTILVILGGLTWNRALVYKSEETLWADTLEHNPTAWIAHSNLGQIYTQEGRIDEAIGQDRMALQFHSSSPETHYNLGAALFQKGQIDEAMAEYRKAIELYPTFPEAHYALGKALAKAGRMSDAIVEFRMAVKFNPGQSSVHNDLGAALFQSGELDEALVEFQEALRIDPTNAAAQSNVAKTNAKLAKRMPPK